MASNDFMSWFGTYLKDKGFRPIRCGSQVVLGPNASHDIDLSTGDWERPTFSSNKPPRWLFHVDPTGGGALNAKVLAKQPPTIAFGNLRDSDRAAIILRVLPILGNDTTGFERDDEFEMRALFVFPEGAPQGSSSETFEFDPNAGILSCKGQPLQYTFSGLLGVRPRNQSFTVTLGGSSHTIDYGQIVDAVASAIVTRSNNAQMQNIATFDLTSDPDVDRLKRAVEASWTTAEPVVDVDEDETVIQGQLHVSPNPDLIGIDQGVYRQINAALQSGKQHIMLYGPPGTGKTTLARWIAQSLTGDHWVLITGSSDWSSQDIIGGYQPAGGGSVAFIPGVLLRNFDRPLIIDELNRCDIDKVIGPLFTVLSGQQTTLPYRINIEDKDSAQYVILPGTKSNRSEHEFSPGKAWRIVATINSIDKASLYQMSYASSRRFGWVYVDVPRDARRFIIEFLQTLDPSRPEPADDVSCPLSEFWSEVNKVRELGPAPIMDAIRIIQQMDSTVEFFGDPSTAVIEYFLDAIDMVFLPLLDGITRPEGNDIVEAAEKSFGLGQEARSRIRNRINSVIV